MRNLVFACYGIRSHWQNHWFSTRSLRSDLHKKMFSFPFKFLIFRHYLAFSLPDSSSFLTFSFLTLSWRRTISYRRFLYDIGLRHERVKFVFFHGVWKSDLIFREISCYKFIISFEIWYFLLICVNYEAFISGEEDVVWVL